MIALMFLEQGAIGSLECALATLQLRLRYVVPDYCCAADLLWRLIGEHVLLVDG